MKRMLSCLLVAAMLAGLLCACGQPDPTTPSTPPATQPTENLSDIPEGYNQLVIYWDRSDDLETAAFWIWPDGGNGQGYPVEADPFGCKTVVNLPESVTRAGFIACYGCTATSGSTWIGGTKDVDADRYVDINAPRVTIYLKSGDPNIYYGNDGGSLETVKEVKMAGMTGFNTIKYAVNPAMTVSSLSQVKVFDGDRQIEITGLDKLNTKSSTGTLTLAETLDLTKAYTIEIENYGTANVIPTEIFDSAEFIENYTYSGSDLGPVIHGSATTFKVWAPTASKVVLNLFAEGHGGEATASVEMVPGEKGVWSHTQENCGHGTYYTYTVTTAVGTQETTDPYAKSAGVNGNRSMVIDLSLTDPAGWAGDSVVELDSYTDAVIWEIHVRDFSNTIASSQYKGKYLAFTEQGLVNEHGAPVGVDYLKALGITHVHLLPVYDYATVDEANPDSGFNWGYDPKNYNVPEGSFSTDPFHGEVRVLEFKQMVQALHEAGIGVIMDVVYNHTYSNNASFNMIVPYYYYRFNADGSNMSASGCGNDTASERYMYGKFMVDSVSYWAEEYHLDGFRFDLMGLHDLNTMQEVEQAVHAINPDAIIYGEGWTMGQTVDGSAQANQGNISSILPSEGAAGGIAVFNDTIRDGLKGSVFDNLSQGYINGAAALNYTKVRFGIDGGMSSGATWRVTNAAVINYMSAHDNNTLWDKLAMANANTTVEQRLAMNRLGAAIVMISKGTPFWQAGEEMLRSKPVGDGTFDHNSYKSSDAINNIRWDALAEGSDEYEMMRYYQGLIEMRKAYSIFRGAEDVKITFTKLDSGSMAALFEGEDGAKALVLINPNFGPLPYTLEGSWKLVADSTRAGAEVLETHSGSILMEPCSIHVYVS